MSKCFPEAKFSGGRMTVELDLSSYVSKAGLKDATSVGTSAFARKIDLANLKSDVDKLDIDILRMCHVV